MAKDKILSLRFYYSGKNLDNAKEGRDIKDKFYIGSDKHLQWQVLDPNFPKKYLLLKKSKDSFILMLKKGMNLTIKKDNNVLDLNDLKNRNIIKGNELFLSKDYSGYVNFSDNWSIAFEFVTPFVKHISEEDRKIIQQYQRRPAPSPQQKLSRNLVVIAILLVLIASFLFEKMYEPPVFERTLAQRVSFEVAPPAPVEYEFEETIAKEEVQTPAAGEETATEVTEERPAAQRGAASILGFDPSAVAAPSASIPTSGVQTITYSEQIVAAGPTGGRPSGQGPGSGAPSIPSRGGSSFDPSAVAAPSAAAPGTLFRGEVDAKRLGLRDVDASILGGVAGDIEVSEITTTAQLSAISQAKERALSAGLETVDEAALESAAPEVKAELISIRQYVQVNFRQIDSLFQQERRVRNMYGSIEVTLFFDPNGQVEAAEIVPRPGSFFTEAFLTKARDLMMQWRVPTQKQLPPYRFPYRFISN